MNRKIANKRQVIYALGPAGTNGHEAAEIALARLESQYGPLEIKFCDQNGKIPIAAVEERCFGVVPVENSSEGLVGEIIKGYWLKQSLPKIRVVGEISIEIHHQLLVQKHVERASDIQTVCSHPQALGQCARRLDRLGISIRKPHKSTAGAAKEIAEELDGMNSAAIASRFAAETYGLKIIRRNIEDVRGNATRFHILGHDPCEPTGKDRTAIIFRVHDRPGALLEAEAVIARQNVNMSSIHSIPLGRPQQYAFYCEFECHADSGPGRSILSDMKRATRGFIVLGSYPQSREGL